jgi:hypothetical protein
MTPPPAGSPNYIMRQVDTEAHSVPGYPTNDILEVYAFSVNWTTPASSSFTKIADILTAEFDSTLCGLTSFYCMGMPGVAQGANNSLDPLREVIMNRLAYRNFGSHQALVGNFVTDIGGNIGGIRWFELRKTGAGPWTLHQEGTYAPTTSDNRWMGGIAMDGAGNIALGYNVSSQTVYPSLRYAGRLATDPLGTLPQGEYTLASGSGNNGSNRYGDYSAMSIDPVDDCTFWFTGQWNSTSQWSTRIAAFRFDACGSPNFSLNVTPESQQVCYPDPAAYNIDLNASGGFSGGVSLQAVNHPGTAAINPNPATPPGNSLLTLSGTALGQYSFELYGTSVITPSLVHSQTLALEVVGAAPGTPVLLSPANGAPNIPAMPVFTWNALPGASTYSIQVASDPGFTNIVASASGLSGPTWTANIVLNTSTTYFWRVQADNACGTGSYSAAWSFTTLPAPGDCGPGTAPNVLYDYGFESGSSGWTSSGTGNTWALSTANPYAGSNHYRGTGVAGVTDQRLVSPGVALPTGQNPLVLKFWHAPNLENNGATACYDGGILEISTNGGATWTQVPNTDLLVGKYTGAVSASFSNPLGGLQAWCGPNPQPYYQTIADISSFAGQTAQFRMRLGTDTSVSRPGWDVDNVLVQSCQPVPVPEIELVKTVGTDPSLCATTNQIMAAGGTEVTYCYTVKNTGNIPLGLHTLEDSDLGILLSDFGYNLNPGASAFLTETATISTTTLNTAIWTAYNPGPSDVAVASASATVIVPGLAILEPLQGQVFISTDELISVPVTITTTEFSIPGDGYWRLSVNGEVGDPVMGYSSAVQLPAGTYTLSAGLYTADHTPLGIVESLPVTLITLYPALNFIEPLDGQIFTTRIGSMLALPVVITTTDFSIPGDGYWNLWVNGESAGSLEGYTTTLQLLPGLHTLSAELYAPDQTPLGYVDSVTVTVNMLAPTVSILAPKEGQVYTTLNGAEAEVALEISTTDFTIPEDGYWRLLVNGEDAGAVEGYTGTVQLLPGQYTLAAELYLADHTALGIMDRVTVTVNTLYPNLSILAPAQGQVFTSKNGAEIEVTVAISTTGFTIPSDGYWRLLVNGEDAAAVNGYSSTVQLLPGVYTLGAELYLPDHTSLEVRDSVQVTVNTEYAVYLPLTRNSQPSTFSSYTRFLTSYRPVRSDSGR